MIKEMIFGWGGGPGGPGVTTRVLMGGRPRGQSSRRRREDGNREVEGTALLAVRMEGGVLTKLEKTRKRTLPWSLEGAAP